MIEYTILGYQQFGNPMHIGTGMRADVLLDGEVYRVPVPLATPSSVDDQLRRHITDRTLSLLKIPAELAVMQTAMAPATGQMGWNPTEEGLTSFAGRSEEVKLDPPYPRDGGQVIDLGDAGFIWMSERLVEKCGLGGYPKNGQQGRRCRDAIRTFERRQSKRRRARQEMQQLVYNVDGITSDDRRGSNIRGFVTQDAEGVERFALGVGGKHPMFDPLIRRIGDMKVFAIGQRDNGTITSSMFSMDFQPAISRIQTLISANKAHTDADFWRRVSQRLDQFDAELKAPSARWKATFGMVMPEVTDSGIEIGPGAQMFQEGLAYKQAEREQARQQLEGGSIPLPPPGPTPLGVALVLGGLASVGGALYFATRKPA